jgi:uncharacterized protein YecE (DUF72 family)
LEVKVGCCGFPVSKGKYYETLNLVEINATFYRYLDSKLLAKWRREAPKDLEFTVKAHQDISHVHKLSWNRQTAQALKRMTETCRELDAEILLIQTPGSLRPKKETLRKAEKFFEKASGIGLTLIWETRGPEWFKPENFKALSSLLEKAGVVHCVDPFLKEPAYTSKLAYFRLHGLGEKLYYYEYSNNELENLKRKILNVKDVKETYVLFNNLAMFNDAVRFKTYLETGNFPPLTDAYGVEAAWRIIKNLRLPASRRALIGKVGWRLLEVKPGKQYPLKTILSKIPDKTYKDSSVLLKEVEKALESL